MLTKLRSRYEVDTDYVVFTDREQESYKEFIKGLPDDKLYAIQVMIEVERYNRSMEKFGEETTRDKQKDPGGSECDWRSMGQREIDFNELKELSKYTF